MKKHSFLPFTFFLGSLFLLLGVLLAPATAQAGFQWVAPVDNSVPVEPPVVITSPPEAPVAVIPPATSAPQVLTPAPETTMAQPAPAAPTPMMAEPQPMMPAAPEPTASVPAVNSDMPLRGFANNVPLVVALRQILPSDYGFSVAQDIPMGELVSWHGGQSWRQTLQNMLQASGMTMKEDEQMISIMRIPGAMASVPSAAPTSAAPLELSPASTAMVSAPEHVLVPPPGAIDTMMADTTGAEPVDETWTANTGDTLHKVLTDWCQRAHVDLSWQAEYDYPVQAAITWTGSFEGAVRNLLQGFQSAQPQPVATLHNNQTAGQAVLVVDSRGNNYSD